MNSPKRDAEMNEGLDAFERFRNAMKTIISVPKSSVMPEKKIEKPRRARASHASRVSRDKAK